MEKIKIKEYEKFENGFYLGFKAFVDIQCKILSFLDSLGFPKKEILKADEDFMIISEFLYLKSSGFQIFLISRKGFIEMIAIGKKIAKLKKNIEKYFQIPKKTAFQKKMESILKEMAK